MTKMTPLSAAITEKKRKKFTFVSTSSRSVNNLVAMFMLHQTYNQAQNSTNTAQTINSLHYHAANSRKCERKQTYEISRGF